MKRLTGNRVGFAMILTMSLTGWAQAAPEIRLCAELELRAAVFFKIGTASLYLADCNAAREQVLERVPKQFSLQLSRSISGDDLIDSAVQSLRLNLGLAGDEPLPESLDCLARAYIDVEAGDRYDVVYRPNDELALYLNDEALRHCPDTGQAEQYFLIWFGDQPFHRRLREELLSRSESSAG